MGALLAVHSSPSFRKGPKRAQRNYVPSISSWEASRAAQTRRVRPLAARQSLSWPRAGCSSACLAGVMGAAVAARHPLSPAPSPPRPPSTRYRSWERRAGRAPGRGRGPGTHEDRRTSCRSCEGSLPPPPPAVGRLRRTESPLPRPLSAQTEELLTKRRELLEKKIQHELERAKDLTRQGNKRGEGPRRGRRAEQRRRGVHWDLTFVRPPLAAAAALMALKKKKLYETQLEQVRPGGWGCVDVCRHTVAFTGRPPAQPWAA